MFILLSLGYSFQQFISNCKIKASVSILSLFYMMPLVFMIFDILKNHKGLVNQKRYLPISFLQIMNPNGSQTLDQKASTLRIKCNYFLAFWLSSNVRIKCCRKKKTELDDCVHRIGCA